MQAQGSQEAHPGSMSDISAMTPEQKRLFLRYGDHRQTCAWRIWDRKRVTRWLNFESPEPEIACDCRWLEALGEACKGAGE